jgi:integrase
MDTTRLTDAAVKRLPVPTQGNRITYDPDVKGFGARVTAAGHRAFILTYYTKGGRQRRYTIGAYPDWSTVGAREEARKLKRQIDQGGDPLAEIAAERGAPTVDDLCRRFAEEHIPRKRPSTQDDYLRAIELHIRPVIGRTKVAAITWSDIDAIHRRITKAGHPYQANRVVALLGKMFALAVRWHMRPDNPAKGIERNVEAKRKRYLGEDELRRLTAALDQQKGTEHSQAADVIRLLLLTGCRLGEALAARWDDIDLTAGTWTKPASTTKQKADHVAPLSGPARQLLAALQRKTNGPWVFPADSESGHRIAIRKNWLVILKAARIKGLRIHDLRHSFASQLASNGASLPLIGSLLGHSNPVTTARYAHLFNDPQREAVERIGAIIANGGRRR